MTSWETIDINDSGFVQGIKSALDVVDGPLEAAAAQAQAAATLLANIQALLGASADLLGAIRETIDTIVTDLLYAGVYGLVVQPTLRNGDIRAPMGIDGFLRTVDSAFYDTGDLGRPRYDWGATTAGVVVVVGASSLTELSVLASALQTLFGSLWSDLIALINSRDIGIPFVTYTESGVVTALIPGESPKSVFVGTSTGYEVDSNTGKIITFVTGTNAGQSAIVSSFNPTTGVYSLTSPLKADASVGDGYVLAYGATSTPPDWYRGRLLDVVPPLGAAVGALVQVRNLLPITGATRLAAKLSANLGAKAQLLSQLSSSISAVKLALDGLSVVPVISILPISPQNGGNGGFMQEAFLADNRPNIPENYYTLGVVLYGGSSTYGLIQRIFGL